MSLNLGILDKIVSKTKYVPDNLDTIYYLFFEKGIGFNEFNSTPIPYIVTVLNVHGYVKEQEEIAYKKANKK